MKKLLLSFSLFVSVIGYSQILSETFEGATFPPTGWTTGTNVPITPWDFTSAVFAEPEQLIFTITGNESAAIGWIDQDQDAHLTSPSFSLVGYSAANLTFNARLGYEYMVTPFANGNLFTEISTDGGTNWTSLWVEEDYGPYEEYETLAVDLDLSAYLGEANVQIRFHYVANDADSLSIDDILIDGTALGVSEFFSNKITVFPNPATNVVNISNKENILLTNITVTDINGRTVKSMEVNKLSEVQINVADLNAGVYFMNITSDSGKAVKKIIKN